MQHDAHVIAMRTNPKKPKLDWETRKKILAQEGVELTPYSLKARKKVNARPLHFGNTKAKK